MTTGLTYSTFVTQLAELAVVDPADVNFQAILPMAITYAENRMCREIDFLFTVVADTSQQLTAGQRLFQYNASPFVTLQQVNVFTPAGAVGSNGIRVPLLPTTKEFLDNVYPSLSGASVPQYFAMFDQTSFVVGPWSNNTYNIEIVGTIRPTSLSASTTTTFISTYLPDLMLMASMIYISGYQRNWGKMSDDPAMALSYESQYNSLKNGAYVEEARKKFQASGWTSMSPPVAASPSR